jgi:heat shock protein HslJ
MGGRWSGTATNLTFSNLMSTRMACMGPAMEIEFRFSALLDKPWRVERIVNGLTVWTAGGQSQFVKVR